jgi:hypothetical protein
MNKTSHSIAFSEHGAGVQFKELRVVESRDAAVAFSF